METSEDDWRISKDGWERYKMMTRKEVHRVAFQSLKQQPGESYTSYTARLKAKKDLCEFAIEVPMCTVLTCSCAHHTDHRQLSYRNEMVGTRLVAWSCNMEHRSKVLAESATLKTLEEKLARLCTLEKSETSAATLKGAQQVEPGVKEVETPGGGRQVPKCITCKKVHKRCSKCGRLHSCSMICHNCNKSGHWRSCCPVPLGKGTVGQEPAKKKTDTDDQEKKKTGNKDPEEVVGFRMQVNA